MGSAAVMLSSSTPTPWLRSTPTAPWMLSPLRLPADHLSNPKPKPKDNKNTDPPLTAGVRGGRSRKAMIQIVRNIKKLRNTIDDLEKASPFCDVVDFSVPIEGEVEEKRAPWVLVEEKKLVFKREKKEREATAAERILAWDLLERLRSKAKRMRNWVKGKKAGITDEVVQEIRRQWIKEELVMLKIVEPLRRNMDRASEIVEIKTGGVVVWNNRDLLVVYRGENYPNFLNSPYKSSQLAEPDVNLEANGDILAGPAISDELSDESVMHNYGYTDDFSVPPLVDVPKGSLYEREANRLLEGLGPRFTDWWWRTPLPVDADLLPEDVTDFSPPIRICPPNVKLKLTDDELTYLRKLARLLPTHFALGKNRRLHGLAAAILKLWEKSAIAKIAVKVGIVNTDNQQMASKLKHLTGGVLLLRNKFFIILFRGKDFLPGSVANVVIGREREINEEQLREEAARSNAISSLSYVDKHATSSTVGTYAEFKDIEANVFVGNRVVPNDQLHSEAEKEKLEKEIRKQEYQLSILKRKIGRSQEELTKLNLLCNPSDQVVDLELLTEEETESFRKIGLKLDDHLLLGRRGIYDGVIGSIHQHWKHREVVKVITKQTSDHQVNHTARLLEIESGGILVCTQKLQNSHAIILYRGKNYTRPIKPVQSYLLTKQEALKRSLEIQRRGSLKFFAQQREQSILDLKRRLRYLQSNAKSSGLLESETN